MDETRLWETLEGLGLRNMVQRGSNIMASCPGGSHQDRRPSWGIHIDAPHLHGCMACGFKGTLRTLLIRVGGMSAREASNITGEDVKVVPRDIVLSADIRKRDEGVQGHEEEELWLYYPTKRSDAYASIRKLSKSTIRACKLLHDPKEDRILFPWFIDGKLVGLTGRALDPRVAGETKVKHYLEGTDKRNLIYLPQGKITREPLVIVEGEFDALVCYEAGHKNVAALGHARLSEGQQRLILNSPATEILVFSDWDKAGRKLAAELDACFSRNRIVRTIDYTPLFQEGSYSAEAKLDPGKLEIEEIQRLLTPSTDQLFPDLLRNTKMACSKVSRNR